MATQYTPILQLALPVTGELNGTWGDVVNDNITSMVEEAIAGLATINTWTANSHTLTTVDGLTDEARCAMIVAQTGAGGTALTGSGNIICPARTKLYVVSNQSAYQVTIKTAAGTGIAVAAGDTTFVFCDGTNVLACVTQITNGHITGNLTVDGNTTLGDASGDTVTINAGTTTVKAQGAIRFEDAAGGDYIAIRAPTAVTTYTLTLPIDDGTNGQALITDGSGNLSWSTAASGDVYGPASATDNAVARFDLTTGKLIQNSVVTIGDTGDVAGVGALSMSGAITLSGGTANGVAYLNGSKVLTSGSALTFDGTNLGIASGGKVLFAGSGVTATHFIDFNSTSNGLQLESYGATLFTLAGGTEAMRLTSTGLGIGTSSPVQKLSVVGSANSSAATIGGALYGGSPRGLTIGTYQSNGGDDCGVSFNAGVTGYGGFKFTGGSTTYATIDSSGNLGLGVTPSAWGSGYKAYQVGNAGLMGYSGASESYLTTNAYYGASGWVYINTAAATDYAQTNGQHKWYTAPSGTAGNAITFTQAMTLDASSNLTVNGTGYFTSGVAGQGAAIYREGSTGGAVYSSQQGIVTITTPGTNPITFQTSATERMRIDSSGNVGIGTSSPAAKLHVSGSSSTDFNALTLRNGDGTTGSAAVLGFEASTGTIGDAAALAGQIKGIRTGIGTSGALAFWTSNAGTPAERMRIDSNGNLLVGTTSRNSDSKVTLYSADAGSWPCTLKATAGAGVYYFENFRRADNDVQVGYISSNGTTTSYVTSSDYRLKENIQPMTGALDVVAQLNPVTYTWKADGSDGQGFIAHELQAVVPDCVTGEKDAVDAEGKPVYQGIDTSFLVATLTKAIQEQQEQINELKAEVAALKAK